MTKVKRQRKREGLYPGESRRKSLVTVDTGLLDKPGQEYHHYIVQTGRLDGAWTHQVDYQGQVWRLPSKVVEALLRHRESIIKEERSRRARDRIVAQAERIAAQG